MKLLSSEYIAGLFDGEGSISCTLNKKTRQIQVRACIAMADEDTIRQLHDQFGGSFHIQNKKNLKHRTLFRWYVTGFKLLDFFAYVGPCLQIKFAPMIAAVELQRRLSDRHGSQRERNSKGHPIKLTDKEFEDTYNLARSISAFNAKGRRSETFKL